MAIGLAATLPSRGPAAQQPVALSVGGFETDGSVGLSREEYDALGYALGAMLALELRDQPGLRVVPLGPIPGPRPGRVDVVAACAAASRAGAKVVVIGTLLDRYGDTRLEARLLDPATRRPIGQVRLTGALGKREALLLSLAELAPRIAAEAAPGTSPAAGGRAAPIPTGAMLEFGRGLRAEGTGDAAGAVRAYRHAVQLAPDFRQAAEALRRLAG